MTPRLLWILLPSMAVVLGGCEQERDPVARLTVEPATTTLPFAGKVELATTWEATAPLTDLEGDLQVFVHLLDGSGELLRTFDHAFPNPWEVGLAQSYAIELWQSALASPLDPGSYPLTLGIYDRAGHRWPLIVGGEEIDDQEYVVAQVEVTSQAASAARVVFSDDWRPVEPGSSKQIPAVRWLVEDGRIEFRELGGPLAVDLAVGIGRLEETGFRLVLDEGRQTPGVELRSDCLEAPAWVEGYGSHEVELILTPADGAAACTIDVDPGFVFLNSTTLDKRSAVLEKLLWAAAGVS